MDGQEAWTRYELVRDPDHIRELLAEWEDKPVVLDPGHSAGPSHSARLTRAPDGWWVAIAHMDHTGLQQGVPASIVLRNGGQRLETPCIGVHQDGCRIGLGEPPWLRYAQSRTEARLAFDGQRIAHLVVRPDSDRPLSAALMDLSANGVGAFLPHALADELRVQAIYPADLHLPSGAAAARVQIRSAAPMENPARWRIGCRFEAPEPPMRSLIRDFLMHTQRLRRM